ncbi:MAG: hypothetical protein BMS9Abin05_2075 [Rhodothermia bacterium]|nr:MAG: hypothetical protein BMS9Abin05_2075 [Rhodothermia bacterium]
MKTNESDWKVFSKHVPDWRERYLDRKNQEIADQLTHREGTPTDRFWSTLAKMKEEKHTLVECFDFHSRSRMLMSLLLMHRHGIIDNTDLNEFSTELQEWIRN